ncbi:MAG: adenylosuccinate synthase [Bacteroidales bacterium]|nr:adenylosuccinate synthase [Bacteroidales bacterium]
MNKIDVLLGLQWGDEGKGKVVDALTQRYQVVARFQGGANAGHSLEFNGIKHVLHLIPSGIFHPSTTNIIGNGVVVDPIVLIQEVEALEQMGINASQTLHISKKAHLILPSHRALDAASEAAKGKDKIGSTLKGIGPTYMDKTGRNGLRVGDILRPDFDQLYQQLKARHQAQLEQYGASTTIDTADEAQWMAAIARMRKLTLIDSEYAMQQHLADGQRVLAEGAQGSLLDIDFGSYPFVTSSNTVCAGACTGLGVAPNRIGEVYGIFKAYCTRVGAGPFPTELFDSTGEQLRTIGAEFGATTGRPRRCGWLDMVALRYAIMVNGVTQLIMTKADVLDTFATIRVATAYRVDGQLTDQLPYSTDAHIEPVYREFEGWQASIANARSEAELPKQLMDYVRFIEEQTGVPVRIISVGPDRNATIVRGE